MYAHVYVYIELVLVIPEPDATAAEPTSSSHTLILQHPQHRLLLQSHLYLITTNRTMVRSALNV